MMHTLPQAIRPDENSFLCRFPATAATPTPFMTAAIKAWASNATNGLFTAHQVSLFPFLPSASLVIRLQKMHQEIRNLNPQRRLNLS
uniref:Uncharacterized protein n=1 Tax=Panagrellus redivivus TaxID=6233 RepID=A0A7E4UXL6_PANRE